MRCRRRLRSSEEANRSLVLPTRVREGFPYEAPGETGMVRKSTGEYFRERGGPARGG